MPTQISFRNHAQRNSVRVKFEDAVYEDRTFKDEIDPKTGKPLVRKVLTKWVPSPQAPLIVKPDERCDAYAAHGQRRIILEEMPT